MNNYYWYLVIPKESKIAVVEKSQGILWNSFTFLTPDTSSKIKSIIKKNLSYAPSGLKYTFAYVENEHTLSVIYCVKIEKVVKNNGVECWNSICAEEFYDICDHYNFKVPNNHKGEWVFNTLKQNTDDGVLKPYNFFYEVLGKEVYVYPLRAIET